MVKQSTLRRLKGSIQEWNTWRRQHRNTSIDLGEANLGEADLREADLHKADLREANLCGADLREADLSEANLCGADLREADLYKANLGEADLSRSKLRWADLSFTSLREADLSGANLSGANLWRANLYMANLDRAHLLGAKLNGADLRGAKLGEANLWSADLSGVDLSESDLSGADLGRVDLSGADLSGANLSKADLSEAILRETLLPMIGHNIATSTPNPSHPSPDSSIEKPTIFLMSGAERTKEHPQQIYILYCYTPTPQDRKLRDQLETHLMVLKRLKQITLRLNREIPIGVNWKEVQDERFHLADLILLLISPDFIASDYHYGIEMHNALEKHKAGNVWVIPILLRPTPFWQQTPLGTLQVLPRNGKAITDHPKRDQVLADITREIGEVVSRLLKRYPSLQAANTSKATQAIGPFCISCGARNPPNTPVCENCGDIL